MTRRTLVVLLAVAALALAGVACSDDSGDEGSSDVPATIDAAGDTSGERIRLGDREALTWGDGTQGIVLAHGAAFDAASWDAQATRMADQGATVVAVEDISPEGIEAAVTHLRDEVGVDQVVLVGGSAGADAILQLASDQPDLPDGLILLSPNSVVEGLGDEPGLFIASEDEPVADVSTELADAGGEESEALLLPGDAHAQNIFDSDQADAALDAVLARLRELRAG